MITIKGIVKNEKGEGIPGAAIMVKDTDWGTVSDIDGNFQLDPPEQDKDYTLICISSLSGRKEIIVNHSEYISIVMEDNPDNEFGNITIGRSCARRTRPTLWQRLTKPFRRK